MAHFPHLFILLILTTPFVSSKKWAEDRAVVARSDFQALKSIKRELVDPLGALSTWNSSGLFGPCSDWAGIKCSRGRVVSIQLPWRELAGRISDEVGQLQSLRRLSLHDNSLAGPLPISLTLLRNLRGLYLFNNRLSGSIPASIGNCLNLQALDLSNNRINGSVPSSIGELTRVYRVNLSRNSIVGGLPYELGDLSNLVFLDLSSNGFDGRIPDSIGDITSLASLDLSRNNLSGSVPFALTEKFNASSFLGNKNLCGYSISTECPSQIAPSPSQPTESTTTIIRSRKLSTKDVILIASGALLLVLLVTCCVLLFCLIRRKRAFSKGKSGNSKAAPAVVVGPDSDSGQEMGGKLVHFDGPFVFTADDLLCATAEIMGKSTYGTAYKATLEEGNNNNNNNNNLVAVKRLKEKISKARKEFEIEIARLGKIRHSNILALRAYYLGPKGEKLLVYDYMPNGSLASFLHARGPETIIPWSTRLSVAIGTTRGLCYLHDHENTIHGNLTSSNVLLDEQTGPKIADVGLSRLMTDTANTDAVATAGTLGYRAPELTRLKNATTKSDVYSLGVIFLELLSGKSPSEADEGCDLPRWVASIVKEEWTNEVFDVELMRGVSGIGDELLNVLKLALHCVDPSPAARPEAREILEKLEEVRPGPSQSPIEVVTTPAASVDGGKQG